MPEEIAIPETAVPVLGKRRVIRNRISQVEATKSAVSQIQMNLIAEPPLRPDAKTITDQQHPDHQLRINRRTPLVAVVWRQESANLGQIQKVVDLAQKVIAWNMIFNRKRVEKRPLRYLPRSHHPPDPSSSSKD
jgi:hypothetical protein